MSRLVPSFKGLSPASARSSRIARAASAKRDTRAEMVLRKALYRSGLRYRVDVAALPGRPDIVVSSSRLAVFCDGDFWHGRALRKRLAKLKRGHNARYWVSKIRTNVARDRRNERRLRRLGWRCLRLWESDVIADPQKAAKKVLQAARRARCRT